MNTVTLIELIAKTKEAIQPYQHSYSTLSQYDYAWRQLLTYFSKHHTVQFSSQLALQYVTESRHHFERGEMPTWKFKLIRKTVSMLIQCHQTGDVKWEKLSSWNQPRFKQSSNHALIYEFGQNLMEKDYGPGTIELRKSVARKFLHYLEEDNAQVSELAPGMLNHFILHASKTYQPTSMGAFYVSLRSFLHFLVAKEHTQMELTTVVPTGFARKSNVIPTLTYQEEEKLINAVNRSMPVGKRNLAILLLALRLGLRAVDIIHLKLENVNWQQSTIEIVQQKTRQSLVLPLLADVGNALIDYLLNARPDSADPYVFLRMEAPYQKLSGKSALYHVANTTMDTARIRQAVGDRKGLHCLRHTIASRLLASETPLPIISSVLGHRDRNASKVYLATDLKQLQACALGLTGIEVTKEELQQ